MRRVFFLVFLFFTSTYVLADDTPNDCAFLSIMISNKTKEVCELVDKEVKSGQFSSSTQAPALIPPGTSAYPFEMRQVFYGPDVVLTYECGEGNVVTFESHQYLCVLKHGSLATKVLYSQNLHAKSRKDIGSYLWSKHGSINWTISAY
ncbi:MAG: hypothetical protein P1U74_04790 [Legionellaceae bacterium]|nr:hypothetical protein [Legionellaceae bacterium]